MKTADGWIKIYRATFEKDLFRENHSLAWLWFWCLGQAAYEKFDKYVGLKKVTIHPGQFITGRKRISEKTNISESSVYRYINILKAEEMITTKSNNKFTIITIVNWAKYQGDVPFVNNERSDNRNNERSNKRSTVKRKNKNVKKENKEINEDSVLEGWKGSAWEEGFHITDDMWE